VPSIILWADPKPGGNIKKMADDIMREIEAIRPQFPKDVEFKILVNPSEFIDSSIKSVVKEVALAAVLAVVILLIFIGSFKNVATAAVEIPLSIIMAFIFMKMFGMNLNLISLGGLALSAGMNVDASVVVMENIFRHFDKAPPGLRHEERLKILVAAVKEVWLPVIAATIASLVVFIPLIMTSGLTNSILGDLAKAVVFSHGMSAVVALLLVPTVRLQMMKNETSFHLQSPIEKQFVWLENIYGRMLAALIRSRKAKLVLYSSIVAVLVGLGMFVLPRLPVEIIGRPETDWMILGYNSPNFTEPRHIESFTEKLEHELNEKFGEDVSYTFTQIQGVRNGHIMLRLKDRKLMDSVWKKLEEQYVNTPTIYYWIEPWNPSEMPIPDPPHVRLEVRGGTPKERAKVTHEIYIHMQETQLFPRVRATPDSSKDQQIVMIPNLDVLANAGVRVADVASFVRTATSGKPVGELSLDNKVYDINMNVSDKRIRTVEDLKGLPVALGSKIVPLSALASVRLEDEEPQTFRLNQNEMSLVTARENENSKAEAPKKAKEMKDVVAKWNANRKDKSISVLWTQADEEVQAALTELKWALVLSVLLIFVVMVIQFGDVMHSLLVLVAIPLGFIGVLLSLYIFKSTLSLNSALGMILMNGIAVANSIILVDLMKRLVDGGMAPEVAAVEASRARLRPILMTSLTTVLGMTPIALGFGEGGRILQPLGIAVAGGLWISMLLTIFVVPTLQTVYMRRKLTRATARTL
jgi:hydrophobic/amphiphilic exporter-1 (mainly G- bacteria), HAE1 family